MAMKMLQAGGLPLVTDGERKADEDNPKGYFEYEPVMNLARDPGQVLAGRGARQGRQDHLHPAARAAGQPQLPRRLHAPRPARDPRLAGQDAGPPGRDLGHRRQAHDRGLRERPLASRLPAQERPAVHRPAAALHRGPRPAARAGPPPGRVSSAAIWTSRRWRRSPTPSSTATGPKPRPPANPVRQDCPAIRRRRAPRSTGRQARPGPAYRHRCRRPSSICTAWAPRPPPTRRWSLGARLRRRGITYLVPDLEAPSFERLTLTAVIARVAELAAAQPTGPLALVGSSFGGLAALHFVDRHRRGRRGPGRAAGAPGAGARPARRR